MTCVTNGIKIPLGVIYYLQKAFTEEGQELMSGIINSYQPPISAITEIELLSWKTASDNDIFILNSFISDSIIFELEATIKLKTIEIRKVYGLKLPDAIIAATAIIMDLILINSSCGLVSWNKGIKSKHQKQELWFTTTKGC